MKRPGVIYLVLLAILSLVSSAATGKGNNGQNSRSFMAQIFFMQQQPGEEIVDPGPEMIEGDDDIVPAWGKMTFSLRGEAFKFVFNGHGLKAGTSYSLIYLPDPLPAEGLIRLGRAKANKAGNVQIKDRLVGRCDLPIPSDVNYEAGAKMALVHSEDVDGGTMSEWNADAYLFGLILIRFDDTNDEIVEKTLYEETTLVE